jgi:hypothetical protein
MIKSCRRERDLFQRQRQAESQTHRICAKHQSSYFSVQSYNTQCQSACIELCVTTVRVGLFEKQISAGMREISYKIAS